MTFVMQPVHEIFSTAVNTPFSGKAPRKKHLAFYLNIFLAWCIRYARKILLKGAGWQSSVPRTLFQVFIGIGTSYFVTIANAKYIKQKPLSNDD